MHVPLFCAKGHLQRSQRPSQRSSLIWPSRNREDLDWYVLCICIGEIALSGIVTCLLSLLVIWKTVQYMVIKKRKRERERKWRGVYQSIWRWVRDITMTFTLGLVEVYDRKYVCTSPTLILRRTLVLVVLLVLAFLQLYFWVSLPFLSLFSFFFFRCRIKILSFLVACYTQRDLYGYFDVHVTDI